MTSGPGRTKAVSLQRAERYSTTHEYYGELFNLKSGTLSGEGILYYDYHQVNTGWKLYRSLMGLIDVLRRQFQNRGTDCWRQVTLDGAKVEIEGTDMRRMSLDMTKFESEVDPNLLKALIARLLILDDFQYVVCTHVKAVGERLSGDEKYRLLTQIEQAKTLLQYFIMRIRGLSDLSQQVPEDQKFAESELQSILEELDKFLLLFGISDSILKNGYDSKLTNEREQVQSTIRQSLQLEKKDQTIPSQTETEKYIRGNINVFLSEQAVKKRSKAIQDQISKIPGVVGVWYTNMTNAMLVDVVVNSYEEADNIESRIRTTEGVSLTKSTFARSSKNSGR
jgi:hypothetical protein